MSWTYSGDPSESDRDMVRFLTGDTDITAQQLMDAEIDAMIAASATVYSAAIECVRALIAKYSRLVDRSIGDLNISYSQRVKSYNALLQQLRVQSITLGGSSASGIWAGGLSQSEKDSNEDDSDLVRPAFKKGQMDYVEPISESDMEPE